MSANFNTTPDLKSLVTSFRRLTSGSGINAQIVEDYYDHPTFFAIERSLEAETGETAFDLKTFQSLVKDGDSVLEIGCGTGRVIFHLAETTAAGRLVGIDGSGTAIAFANDRIRTRGLDTKRLELRQIKLSQYALDKDLPGFDVVVIADATLNVFVTQSDLSNVLSIAKERLNAGGQIALSIFADDALEQLYAALHGNHTVHEFIDADGQTRLAWWSMEFAKNDALLHRTACVQTGTSPPKCLVANLFDRIWTPSSIAPVLNALGLRVVSLSDGTVDGGAAKGVKTVTLVLTSS